MPMKTFQNKDAALDYAKSLGKNDSEVAIVDGDKTFLTSTSLPIESRFREPINELINDFLKEIGFTDENEIDDLSLDISGQVSEKLLEMLDSQAKVKILSPYLNY